MTRRGRCQCGHILHFQHGPNGFKVRCPQCGSVVRLRPHGRRTKAASRSSPQLPDFSSEAPVAVGGPETFPALPPAATEPEPVLVVELVPLTSPAPPKFWTRRQLLLTFGAGLAALLVGALICWFVWQATRAS